MQNIDIVFEAARGLLLQLVVFLPRLAIAVAILLVGWLVAKAVRFGVVRALRAVNFHVLTLRAGVDGLLEQGGSKRDTTQIVGLLAYLAVILVALLAAFNSLGLPQITAIVGKILLFVPRLLVALLVLVFGSYFARFGDQAMQGYARGVGISDADLLGRAIHYGIMIFVVLLAVDHLNIGGGLIQQTFLILLGGVVLALALAFGLGGRSRAAELIERWFPRDPR